LTLSPKVYRLYCEAGLNLRLKSRRKRPARGRINLLEATRPNERWSMDFVSDELENRRRIRALTVVDNFTHGRNIKLDFIRPGKPVENAYIESFNGRLRDECLNQQVFIPLEDARKKKKTGESNTTMNDHTALRGT
jgi:putative transposase